MINRKMLYGYQIRNGALEIVPEEQRTVSMVFTLYNAGASYQAISDALNRQSIPYCREVPLWNKYKVKRLLENPRYTGKEGYPILVEADIFQAAQEKTAEKNARKQSHGEKPAIARLTPYFRCACGGKMTRLGGGWQDSGKLYLRCKGCGNTAVTDMETTVTGSSGSSGTMNSTAVPPTRPLRRSCGWTMPSTGGWSSQTRRKR